MAPVGMHRFPPHSQLLTALKAVLGLQVLLFFATVFYAYHKIDAPPTDWRNVLAVWATLGGFLLGFAVDLFLLVLLFLRAENKKRFMSKGAITLLVVVLGLLAIYVPSINWANYHSPAGPKDYSL
jgi:hypothetical protein